MSDAVFVAKQVLQQDAQAQRQSRQAARRGRLQRPQAVVEVLATFDTERVSTPEAVATHRGSFSGSTERDSQHTSV